MTLLKWTNGRREAVVAGFGQSADDLRENRNLKLPTVTTGVSPQMPAGGICKSLPAINMRDLSIVSKLRGT